MRERRGLESTGVQGCRVRWGREGRVCGPGVLRGRIPLAVVSAPPPGGTGSVRDSGSLEGAAGGAAGGRSRALRPAA